MRAPKLLLPTPVRLEFALLGGVCAVLALLVKMWLRPQHIGGEATAFLLGVAPNFFFSFGMPFLSLSAFQGKIDVRGAMCLAGVTILYEFVQLRTSRRTFDPWDIAATLLGVLSFYLAYRWRLGRAGVPG